MNFVAFYLVPATLTGGATWWINQNNMTHSKRYKKRLQYCNNEKAIQVLNNDFNNMIVLKSTLYAVFCPIFVPSTFIGFFSDGKKVVKRWKNPCSEYNLLLKRKEEYGNIQ